MRQRNIRIRGEKKEINEEADFINEWEGTITIS